MKSLQEIQDKIINKEDIHFIFDYCNRITPYIRPSLSFFFSPMFKRMVENWSKKEFITTSIITDKNIKNFKTEFPIDTTNVVLYGVTGAEAEIAKNKKNNLDTDYKKTLKNLYNALCKEFTENKKLIIEFEDWSINIHTQSTNIDDKKKAKKIITDFIKKNQEKFDLKLIEETNKMSIVSNNFNIKDLLEKIISKNDNATIIYVGINESTFSFLKKKCNTLKVIAPGDSMDSKAELTVFRENFEDFLVDTNNLYI